MNAILGIADSTRALSKIEFSAVLTQAAFAAICRLEAAKIEVEVAQGLVRAHVLFAATEAPHSLLGSLPVFGIDPFPHRFKIANMPIGTGSIAVVVVFHGSRSARPEALFIDIELFAVYPTKEHHTNTTIADRQGLLLPFHRRLIIP